jgi:hypothetical protein
MGVTVGHDENERGRELLAHELHERTVVILQKEGRPMFTTWVAVIGNDYVAFHAGETNVTLVLKRNPDGTMEDDTPAQVRAFEYLGEI